MDFTKSRADALREAREAKGLSRHDVAWRASLSDQSIYLIETGKSRGQKGSLLNIDKILGTRLGKYPFVRRTEKLKTGPKGPYPELRKERGRLEKMGMTLKDIVLYLKKRRLTEKDIAFRSGGVRLQTVFDLLRGRSKGDHRTTHALIDLYHEVKRTNKGVGQG